MSIENNPTPSVTEEMIEAGVRKAGEIQNTATSAEFVSEIYLAMRAADQPPQQTGPQNAKELLASDPDLAMRVGYERRILAAECDAMRRVNGVLEWLKTCVRHARYTPDVIDHKAADTMENIAKRLEAAFEDYTDDSHAELHTGLTHVELEHAKRKWWNGLCRQGDPIRRPNLSWKAFDAGWQAAIAAMPQQPVHADEVELQIAEIVHSAMAYAVREFKGEPQPWQNGNSTAESYARREAREIAALLVSDRSGAGEGVTYKRGYGPGDGNSFIEQALDTPIISEKDEQ